MNDAPNKGSSQGAWLNCVDCGSSSYPTHFETLEVHCNHCTHSFDIDLPTKVQPRQLEDAFSGGFSALGTWGKCIAAVASSPDDLLLEQCPSCKNLATVPDSTPIHLSCQACGSVREFPIGEHAIDLIPEGNFTLDMRMGPGRFLSIRTHTDHRVVGIHEDAVCPACDAPVPSFEGEHRCGSCNSLIVAWSRCGKRFFPGMVIKGHINREQLDGWYSLTEAHRLLEEPLKGMKPVMDLLALTPKIIGFGFLFLLLGNGVLFGLFWLLGTFDSSTAPPEPTGQQDPTHERQKDRN